MHLFCKQYGIVSKSNANQIYPDAVLELESGL